MSPPAAGAILGKVCGSLSAQALASWYAARFIELGGTIWTSVRITGFDLATGGTGDGTRPPDSTSSADSATPLLTLTYGLPERILSARTTTEDRYQAGSFLLAAGCWLQDLLGPLGIASTVYPKKRQLFGFSVPDPCDIYGDERLGRLLRLPLAGQEPRGGTGVQCCMGRRLIEQRHHEGRRPGQGNSGCNNRQ